MAYIDFHWLLYIIHSILSISGTSLKIAVIGGSIAGSALALLLKDQFNVTLFERADNLTSRGAGITLPIELLQTLLSNNLIDQDTRSHSCTMRSFYCHSDNEPLYGACLWQQPISMASLHWDTLFTNFRKRISNQIYRQNAKVVDVVLEESAPAQITLESGETFLFDLVVFADGAHSLGKKLIAETLQPEYSGYVAWRGVLDFDLIQNKTLFNEQGLYYCFNNGHLLTYPVYLEQKNKLNWVFYEKLTLAELNALGSTRVTDFSIEAKKHVHQLAREKLPKIAAQIILDTPSPFMQKIVDVCANKMVNENALLIGDASAVLRPHVGNGASLAIYDALTLSEQLNKQINLKQALTAWEKEVLPKRLAMYDLSKRMADALVLNPVSWQDMHPTNMPAWWDHIICKEKWYTTTEPKN